MKPHNKPCFTPCRAARHCPRGRDGIRKIVLTTLCALTAFALSAQSELTRVLGEIEANNTELAALRKLRDANTVAARVGNSLENPEVEFGYTWNSPAAAGKGGEVSVSQAFDFPTVYSNRNKLAGLQARRYGNEYLAARQKVLLKAQECYIEVQTLRRIGSVLEYVAENARRVADIYQRKVEAGQANVLELNEARFTMIGHEKALRLNQAQLHGALERLAGLNGGEAVTVDRSEYDLMPELPSFEKVYEDYLHLSPELAAAAVALSEADMDVRLSRSQSLPKLSLGYKHEYGRDEKANGLTVGVSIPMFGNRNNVKRARAQSEYARAQLENVQSDLRSQLRELYARLEILNASLGSYDTLLDPEKAVEYIQKALDAGQISVTEYFSQLQPVYESQLAVFEMQREYLADYARLNMIYL